MKTAVVVGGTSGLGRATVAELHRRGWAIVATGSTPDSAEAVRRQLGGEDGPPIRVVAAELRDPAAAAAAIEEALADLPPLDLWVQSAATMPPEADWAAMRDVAMEMVGANLGGTAWILAWAAERLEAQGRGRLVVVGSVAGDRGRKAAPLYGATKAGVHALADGLRHRLHGSGVSVTTVRPGWVATRMLPAEKHTSPLTLEPARAAWIVVEAALRGRDVVYLGWWWRVVGGILRLLPSSVHKRIAPP